jgi:hypothetical protein
MESNNKHFDSLIRLLLPPEIFEYFEIIQIDLLETAVHVHLDELKIKPSGFENEKLSS